MTHDVVINGVTYPDVAVLEMINASGEKIAFYPDAVRYNPQTLTEAQQAQARANIGALSANEVDKQAIADIVIAHLLGQPIIGIVDDSKHINLSGTLPVGTYTLKYDGVNDEYSEIVTLTITEKDKEKYTNVLPLAQEYASNSPYIGIDGSVGYGNNMRISTSVKNDTYMKAEEGVDTTAMIPVKRGDILRFKNCNLKVNPVNGSYGTYAYGFNSNKVEISGCFLRCDNITNRVPCVIEGDEIVQITLEPLENWTTSNMDDIAYIMIGTDGLDETSIITINQEIV